MIRTHRILAAIAATLLYPSVALAADGSTSPPELVSLIFASWGQWSVVAGLGILIAVQVWRTRIKPKVWESMPSLLRRALPPAISALTAAGGAIASGGTWAEFAQVFVAQWVTLEWAAGLAGAMRGLTPKDALGRPLPAVFTEADARERVAQVVEANQAANAKPSDNPTVPPAAAMVFLLVALGMGGCAPSLRSVAPPQVPEEVGASELGERTPQEQTDRCERTADAAWWLRSTSGALVVAAGAEGAGAIPVDDPEIARGLAIGAGITAGTAAVLGYWGNALEQRYVEECTGE